MEIYDEFPQREILEKLAKNSDFQPVKVNAHLHTPYSFSSFQQLEDLFRMSNEEKVEVLGINDFNTMAGYSEFAKLCSKYRKLPLFNIEFMGLLRHEQDLGVRVNDPTNPGRIYLCGKGLDFPVSLSGRPMEILEELRRESDRQTDQMVKKLSAYLSGIDPNLVLEYSEILENHSGGMVRERHIARRLRLLVFQHFKEERARKEILERIYGGRPGEAEINNHVAIEDEIRTRLLKQGGIAYVKEEPSAFPEAHLVVDLIEKAGGIPCYPVLLDDKNGNVTRFESSMERLDRRLTELKIRAVELIPGRNRMKFLKPFVSYFHERDYVITLGTEHNTPKLFPVTVSAADNKLDEDLEIINYEGACILTAHQYLRSRGEKGYTKGNRIHPESKKTFVSLGNALIHWFINN